MKPTSKKLLFCSGLLLLLPTLAQAHTGVGPVDGWRDGFRHPLDGWDHWLAMLAVGLWAARHRGRGVWCLPFTFILSMALGALFGVSGVRLPAVELIILLSVVVFTLLAIRRTRLSLSWSIGLVAFLAFFHGFAHGTEMPGSASLLAFGLGFVLATLLLHGLGLVTARVAALVMACCIGSSAHGQTTNSAGGNGSAADSDPVTLPQVVVTGRGESLLGIADSAAQGSVGAAQLQLHNAARAAEILETVPGVITTQHAGGGKATQYFLRGFNLDHGTDFATSLDGMSLNMPTHGHGQGYTDLNVVIPELIERINYQKGVYYAENGDFSSAGAAHLQTVRTLPATLAILEGGMYGYARGVFASSPKLGPGHLLYGLEAFHHDGPWENPDDFQKFNGLLTYSQGDSHNGFSVTARGYHGAWDSSDQVATSAIEDGLVPFFGSLDDTTGGDSQRYSLQGEWHRNGSASATKIAGYGFFYDLDLFSNFTYFLTDTNRGDQFEQVDERYTGGLLAEHKLFGRWQGREIENTFGLQFRHDAIQNGLFQTQARRRVDKTNSFGGTLIPATVREDDIAQTSIGIYYENRLQWTEKVRSIAGVRGDFYRVDVESTRNENSDERTDALASPKLAFIFGPWAETEIYVQGGLGFHSNDGRGATTRVDPITGNPTDSEGNPIQRADLLVQSYGAEIGARTLVVPGLQSTLSLWWLDIDSELVFVGDAGTTEASRPSRRYGIEWANFYQLTRQLTLDADFSWSHSEFRDDDPAGDHIPGSIEHVIAAGLSYRAECGFFGSLRLRYFGPRPLIEDNSFRSEETIMLSAQLGYRFNKTWTVRAEIFNLLDRRDHDIDYAYESRVRPGDAAITQEHFHPVEPIQARFSVTAQF